MTRKILALSAVAFIGWHVGGVVPPAVSALGLGAIFGIMAAIPVLLIATTNRQRVRHDHYHHVPAETSCEPQKAPLALSVRPTQYTVVTSLPALTVGAQSRIEVGE